MGPHLEAWTLQKNKLHQANALIDIFPEMQFRQLVTANDPMKFIMRIQRPKVASRVDRVAYPATSKFDIGNLKSAVPLDCRASA